MSEAVRHRDLGAEAIITPYLTEDETLRWAGRPARFPVTSGGILIVVLSFLLALLSGLVHHPVMALFPLLGSLSIAIAPAFQVYGIKDRRITIKNRILAGNTYNVSFSDHIWKERYAYDSADMSGMGTIWIYDHPKFVRIFKLIRPIFVPSNSPLYEVGLYKGRLTQALFNIEDSAYVESLLPLWHNLD